MESSKTEKIAAILIACMLVAAFIAGVVLSFTLQNTQRDLDKALEMENFLSGEILGLNQAIANTPPVIQTVIVYQPNTFREFSSVDAMKLWLASNALTMKDFAFPDFGPGADCEDLAQELQRRALADGYLMSIQYVNEDGKIGGFAVKLPGSFHAGLTLTIGNDIWYIESLPPHEAILIGKRD